MTINLYLQNNLSRLVDEGRRQTIFEEYQMKNVLLVLNSKIDFVQPLRTQLTTITKSANSVPGKIDKINTNQHFKPKEITTTNREATTTEQPQIRPNNKEDRIAARRKAEGKRRSQQTIFNPRVNSTPTKQQQNHQEYIFLSPVRKKRRLDQVNNNKTDILQTTNKFHTEQDSEGEDPQNTSIQKNEK